jgi:SNF2 family DNA or RNA helicase
MKPATTNQLNGVLRGFQSDAITYAEDHGRRVLIADEMGLGKTITAIGALHKWGSFPAIVVCPATLKKNWEVEIQKWLPSRTVHVLNKRTDPVPIGPDIYVVNYELLRADRRKNLPQYRRAFIPQGICAGLLEIDPQALIVDESHYCKSETAKRTYAVESLSQRIKTVLLLSGTPVVNRPSELISQLRILGRLQENFRGKWAFAHRYCQAKKNRFGWDITGSSNTGELHRKLTGLCMIRRTKAEVLPELPEKTHNRVLVEISNRRAYNSAESAFIAYVRKTKGDTAAWRASKAEALSKMSALRQLSGKGKVKAVAAWAKRFPENGESLVLFAAHRETQQALAKEFEGFCVTILGTDSKKKRHEAVEKFQNSEEPLIAVCSLKAASEGLTLTRSAHVAFAELGWTPKDLHQASDRTHRIGQKRPVTVWVITAECTIDEQIEAMVSKKINVVSNCTDGGLGKSIQNDLLEGFA